MALYKNTKIIGKGEQTIVLSHGFGASQHLWDNMLSFLQERYQLVLFDWDFSNKAIETSNYTLELLSEALISLLDDLKVEKVIFVGHSMAGMISCIASIRRPDLFVHLLLLGASPRWELIYWYSICVDIYIRTYIASEFSQNPYNYMNLTK